MGLEGLFDVLRAVPAYREVLAALDGEGRDAQRVTSLEQAKPYLIATMWRELGRPMLLVCPKPEDARRLVDQLGAYCDDDSSIHHFAESEVLPYERLALDLATLHPRIEALSALTRGGNGGPPLIVASTMALMQQTIGADLFGRLTEHISVGQRLALEPLLEGLARMGYTFGSAVEQPGSVSRRGGIVDIFSPQMDLPARIELWGDVVDSIRLFDPATQRSVEPTQALILLPAWEVLPAFVDHGEITERMRALDFRSVKTGERDRIDDELAELMAGLSTDNASFYAGFFHQHTLLDHLDPATAPLVLIDEPAEVEEAAHHWEASAARLRLIKQERGELPDGFPVSFTDWSTLAEELGRLPRIEVSRYHLGASASAVELPFEPSPAYHGNLDEMTKVLGTGRRGLAVVATQHSQRLGELFHEAAVPVQESRSLDGAPLSDVVQVVHAPVAGGWMLREREEASAPLLTLLTDTEVFGTAKRRSSRPRRRALPAHHILIEDLTPGQFVVHVDHGVARFAGTQTMDGGVETGEGREYLVLEYADRDRLYVPMEQLARVSLYSGGDDADPSLTRLGTQEWSRTVARARESTLRLAVDLLAVQAQRQLVQGHAFAPDTPWQREMEDAFPYVETPDQATAILDVKEDMQGTQPMDRLICGDVGYGKTEVALRATFKAVMEGKQVAVLVPTTVLAQQHAVTFAERLDPYPLRLEVLSRFRTDAEQDQVIAALKEGEVDVVIGTHRLVQKDVGFKDLGLVVIDEEHRFGVNHKERLKDLRREVDVLTMTATPIPRTMHMALAGIRDISTIETPPEERLPIKTYLAEASDDLVREAIQRELDRGGQVYFLHNRVKSIGLTAGHLRELVPEARIAVAHGQMPEDLLADEMERFAAGDADILVCTTIIESGLDIPSVNTLIIDRADRLGLAQLYQLRGRIGRRAQRGYAYLLVPPGKRLTEAAQRRLQTIVAATELGAGFRIAMRDLEIRGAGNILGAEQSGHIHAVGFDLYTRLLAEAVQQLRASGTGSPAPIESDPQVDLHLGAGVPEDLVAHLPTRMGLYQRMARARTVDDVEELAREFRDRFGHTLPDDVHHLLYGVRVSVMARLASVEAVIRRGGEVTIKLREPTGGARLPLARALGHDVQVGHQQIRLAADGETPWGQALLEVLERLAAFREQMADQVASIAVPAAAARGG